MVFLQASGCIGSSSSNLPLLQALYFELSLCVIFVFGLDFSVSFLPAPETTSPHCESQSSSASELKKSRLAVSGRSAVVLGGVVIGAQPPQWRL